MLLEIPLQKSFNNISQRYLSGLMIAFSDLKQIEADVSEKSQKDFHDIMKKILLSLYNNPESLGLPISPDDYFSVFMCRNQRPEFNKFRKKIEAYINDFYKILYFAGNMGTIEHNKLVLEKKVLKDGKIKINNQYGSFLTSIGITTTIEKEQVVFMLDNDMLRAWELLAKSTLHTKIYDKTRGIHSVDFGLLKFACALYRDDFSYYQNNMELLHNLPKGYFTSYIEELKELKFNEDTFGNLFEVEFKIKGKVSGFAIRFFACRDEQFHFMAENCQGVKAMLADFQNLPSTIQDYLVLSCGKCHSCMGCTKGGKAKVFTVNVNYKGQQVALCPQFNRREWFASDLNKQFMDNLIAYIKLQEKYGTPHK